MKTLVLLVIAGAVGWFAFRSWSPEEPPPPALEAATSESAVPMKTEPVEFAVKVRVRRLIEEWKNRSAGSAGTVRRPSMTDIEAEIRDIRRRLYDKGLHDEKSLKELMTRAAVELGHAPEQAQYLISKIFEVSQTAPLPRQLPGSVAPEGPEQPASRMRSVGGGN